MRATAIAGQQLGAAVEMAQAAQERFAIGFQAIKRELGSLAACRPGGFGARLLPFAQAANWVISALVQRPLQIVVGCYSQC